MHGKEAVFDLLILSAFIIIRPSGTEMAKNYLNLDHMARHLPQALKTKSDQPHSLLSDEEPMDDEGSGAKNRLELYFHS